MHYDIRFSIWHLISDSANNDDFLPLRCASVIIVDSLHIERRLIISNLLHFSFCSIAISSISHIKSFHIVIKAENFTHKKSMNLKHHIVRSICLYFEVGLLLDKGAIIHMQTLESCFYIDNTWKRTVEL